MHENIQYVSAKVTDISPTILHVTYFKSVGIKKPKEPMKKRYCYDYELEFYTKSDGGEMLIEGISYPVKKDQIIFRKPGQYVQGITSYDCYVVCFDLINNTNKNPSAYSFNIPQDLQNYIINPMIESIPPVSKLRNANSYHQLFDELLKVFTNADEAAPLLMRALLSQILYLLVQDTKKVNNHSDIGSSQYELISEAIDYMHRHFKDKINLELLGKVSNLSPSYFHKVFKEFMHISPIEYLIQLRLEKAQELLIKENASIATIAYQCGFNNLPYFYDLFKRRTGITPTELRNNQRYSD